LGARSGRRVIRPFLTKRQIEVLKLRMKGLTQEQVADILKTSRENVANLENRAYVNITRARITLKILEELNPEKEVVVLAGTPITDVPRIVLDRADMLGIKIAFGAETIYRLVKKKAVKRGDHLTAPLRVKILPSGKIKISS
jgi:Tfx family DNA-binding protein